MLASVRAASTVIVIRRKLFATHWVVMPLLIEKQNRRSRRTRSRGLVSGAFQTQCRGAGKGK